MRAKPLIATLLSGGILVGGSMLALAQTSLDTDRAGSATGKAPSLSLHEVQLQLGAMGYRDLTKIEREHDKLEIEATDPQGRRVEIDVDPVTGDVLATEVERDKRRRTDTDQASWLTMHQVQVKLEAIGYRDIEEIERERNGYEAKATNAQGQRVKLAVTPRSGDVTEIARAGNARGRSID